MKKALRVFCFALALLVGGLCMRPTPVQAQGSAFTFWGCVSATPLTTTVGVEAATSDVSLNWAAITGSEWGRPHYFAPFYLTGHIKCWYRAYYTIWSDGSGYMGYHVDNYTPIDGGFIGSANCGTLGYDESGNGTVTVTVNPGAAWRATHPNVGGTHFRLDGIEVMFQVVGNGDWYNPNGKGGMVDSNLTLVTSLEPGHVFAGDSGSLWTSKITLGDTSYFTYYW